MSESLILIFAVILSIIVFGTVCMCRKSEHFSPTGWTQNCPSAKPRALSPKIAYGPPWSPEGVISVDDSYIAGTYSPGSVFKCDNIKDCAMIQVKGCPRKEDIPRLRENLPIGWGSTMTGPYADNNGMMNVNGVNKATMRNPYGKVFPHGDQMYGYFEKGTRNYFDE